MVVNSGKRLQRSLHSAAKVSTEQTLESAATSTLNAGWKMAEFKKTHGLAEQID
jgi:hypothetical protein